MVRVKERFKMLRPVFVPFILYIGALGFSTVWIEDNPVSNLRIVVSLLPIMPAVWVAVSLISFMKKLDELEQRVVNEAAAFSFMLTFLLLLSISFLGFAGIEMFNPTIILLFMVVFVLIGKVLGNRRYK